MITSLFITLFFQMPSSNMKCKTVAPSRWNFPHCLGSLDGKHVQIVAPHNSGSMFYNYKGTHSTVLLVVADAKYNVIYADVGCQGRISDGGVFSCTTLSKKIKTGKLDFPPPQTLPGRAIQVPVLFVADDAFALSPIIMKPYPGQKSGSSSPERIFNYRLSRARRIVKNVFGILSARFRVLLITINLHPDKVESVVLSCVYLHNFLRRDIKKCLLSTRNI